MEKQEKYDLVEDYISGRLDSLSKKRFEALLLNDKELALYFQLHEDLKLSLNTDFREKLIELKSQKSAENQKVSFLKAKIIRWCIAASVLVLMVILSIFWPTKASETITLFKENFIAPVSLSPDLSNHRGDIKIDLYITGVEKFLLLADKFYMEGNTEKAITTLLEYSNLEKNDRINFQLGILYLIQENARQASIEFDKVKEYKHIDLPWYKALTYLKMGDKSKAIEVLISLKNNEKWSKKANSILEKLNK